MQQKPFQSRRWTVRRLIRAGLWCTLAVLPGCYPLSPLPTVEGADNVRISTPAVVLHAIYLPPKEAGREERHPAVVILPRFTNLGLHEAIAEARQFSEAGFMVLLLSLRGRVGTGGKDDCGLHQPDDVVAVLEWVAARESVDPSRLALVGHGRGGQVALLAGARTERVRAVVAIGAPTDIGLWRSTTGHPGIPAWIDSVCEGGREGDRRRSPLTHAGRMSAPVLLVHGSANKRIPHEQSRLMAAAMQQAGKPVEFHLVEGASHRFNPRQSGIIWNLMIDFLKRTMRKNPA